MSKIIIIFMKNSEFYSPFAKIPRNVYLLGKNGFVFEFFTFSTENRTLGLNNYQFGIKEI